MKPRRLIQSKSTPINPIKNKSYNLDQMEYML